MKKFLIPLVLMAGLGVLLWMGLSRDPRMIPSPLIGKPLPSFRLATLEDPHKEVSTRDLLGHPYLLNVWASWCVSCREEQPALMALARQNRIPIIGLDYKDTRADALKTLAALGNPYAFNLTDTDGQTAIDLGVYGVPETFFVDARGIVRYKQIGPISPEILRDKVEPQIDALLKTAPG